MHPCRGHDLTFEEQSFTIACVMRMLCMHSVFGTHTQQAAHPMLEQPRIEGVCRGRGQRRNSGGRFTLPLRGHSPGPSGLGGVYWSKLLRANIFQSTAGQSSVRSTAGSSWLAPAAVWSTPFSAIRAPVSVPHEARRSRALQGSANSDAGGQKHPRGTSSSGPCRRGSNKSPNGVSAMPSRVLRSGMRSATTGTGRG